MANVLIIIKKFKVWEIHFQKNDNINQNITLDVHICTKKINFFPNQEHSMRYISLVNLRFRLCVVNKT